MKFSLASSFVLAVLSSACLLAEARLRPKKESSRELFRHNEHRQLQEGTWNTITYDDFERGWGSFVDGGSDAILISGKQLEHVHQGRAALRLRDGSSTSYVSQDKDSDVTSYSDLQVSFWFRPRRMEDGESLVLEYTSDGGTTWNMVKRWVIDGATYKNENFYQETVDFNEVPEFDYDLTNQARIRFRCDANQKADYIYIDEVLLQGLIAPGTSTPLPTPAPTPFPTPAPTPNPTLQPVEDPTPKPTPPPTPLPTPGSSTPISCPEQHCGTLPVTTMNPTQCDFAGIERSQLDVFTYEGVDMVELLGPADPADAAAVVISVPHGGYEMMHHLIADRVTTSPLYCPSGSCAITKDTNTLEIALFVMDMFIQNYCKVPYVVINKMHRSKLDANRDITEAAQGNVIAEQAWLAYHNFIQDAQKLIVGQMGTVTNVHNYEGARGLLLDLHGYSGYDWDVNHGGPFIHWGYRINSSDLDPSNYCPLDDRSPWSNSEVGTLSQARFLPNQSYECLVRGPGSLGARLSDLLPDMGLCGASIPSYDYPSPLVVQTDPAFCEKMASGTGECKYYNSGYNTQVHEHLDWINLSGIKFNTAQIELPRCIRFDDTTHEPFADSLSITLCSFLRDVFGEGTC